MSDIKQPLGDSPAIGKDDSTDNVPVAEEKTNLSHRNDDLESVNLQDAEFANIDEAKVLRKMDLRLIPMLAILYLLCFLDRGNIGNAKIEGMMVDLNLVENEYNLACKFSFPLTCDKHPISDRKSIH